MFGWQEIMIVTVLLVLLFGRGKISDLMGDVAKGIKSFKKGIKDEEAEETTANKTTIEHDPAEKVDVADAARTKQEAS